MRFVRVTAMVKVCPWVVTFLKPSINMTMLTRPMAFSMMRSRAFMVRCDVRLFSVMLRMRFWYRCRFLVLLIESCRMMLNWCCMSWFGMSSWYIMKRSCTMMGRLWRYLFVRMYSLGGLGMLWSFVVNRGLMMNGWFCVVNLLSVMGRSLVVMYRYWRFVVDRCLLMDRSRGVHRCLLMDRSRRVYRCLMMNWYIVMDRSFMMFRSRRMCRFLLMYRRLMVDRNCLMVDSSCLMNWSILVCRSCLMNRSILVCRSFVWYRRRGMLHCRSGGSLMSGSRSLVLRNNYMRSLFFLWFIGFNFRL